MNRTATHRSERGIMTLSAKAERIKETYKELAFWELHRVQQVHISDYQRYKLDGCDDAAEKTLEVIGAFGEVLDERDGTK